MTVVTPQGLPDSCSEPGVRSVGLARSVASRVSNRRGIWVPLPGVPQTQIPREVALRAGALPPPHRAAGWTAGPMHSHKPPLTLAGPGPLPEVGKKYVACQRGKDTWTSAGTLDHTRCPATLSHRAGALHPGATKATRATQNLLTCGDVSGVPTPNPRVWEPNGPGLWLLPSVLGNPLALNQGSQERWKGYGSEVRRKGPNSGFYTWPGHLTCTIHHPPGSPGL